MAMFTSEPHVDISTPSESLPEATYDSQQPETSLPEATSDADPSI